MDDKVLIVGAGPTGLVLALWLTAQGVQVRIIDRSTGPGETSRAMAVQARTLELYRQLDIADSVVAAGHKDLAMNFWAGGKKRANLSLGDAGEGMTPYPFLLVYPQDQHERFLIESLTAAGVTVERQTELLSFEEKAGHVVARLRKPDRSEETCTSRYIAGCDGARSQVRKQLDGSFEGGTYKQIFYVADVSLTGLEPASEAHIALDGSDFVMVLPYGDSGQFRLIGTVRDERAEHAETLTFEDVSHEAITKLGVDITQVHWFSHYRVHHRVTDSFRHGRAFLLGDAAHVHSPAGGQGMNTGIGDAINLAWKLAAVMHNHAPDALLDTFDAERRTFAQKVVDTTDRLFTFATAQGSFANFVRTHIFPTVASLAYGVDHIRVFMFRTVSQIMLTYQGSLISQGEAGEVKGGDRLPWVVVDGIDNYAPLSRIGWQLQVYGSASQALQTWCERHAITLRTFVWNATYKNAGLAQDAAYLLRPDTYVAFACREPSPTALDSYLSEHGFALRK
ncbi:NAD(P)-binding protein [Duganella sp. FT134W]|uniref:NAD(P)-binding protein n=1 Tax=Duganella margarita TaxID=2692170 RepID=A0A7X4H2E7_9BURK|nr:FAD-dependent monooxygenase [Duganella margarita]MYM74068.1 NAD(P)-binding protein [Duganella margarita]